MTRVQLSIVILLSVFASVFSITDSVFGRKIYKPYSTEPFKEAGARIYSRTQRRTPRLFQPMSEILRAERLRKLELLIRNENLAQARLESEGSGDLDRSPSGEATTSDDEDYNDAFRRIRDDLHIRNKSFDKLEEGEDGEVTKRRLAGYRDHDSPEGDILLNYSGVKPTVTRQGRIAGRDALLEKGTVGGAQFIILIFSFVGIIVILIPLFIYLKLHWFRNQVPSKKELRLIKQASAERYV